MLTLEILFHRHHIEKRNSTVLINCVLDKKRKKMTKSIYRFYNYRKSQFREEISRRNQLTIEFANLQIC